MEGAITLTLQEWFWEVGGDQAMILYTFLSRTSLTLIKEYNKIRKVLDHFVEKSELVVSL